MIPQVMAAQAIGKDIGKGDKGTVMPVIKIVNRQVKTSLIITGVVIAAIGIYVGGRSLYWSIKKKKAEKKDEAKNAKAIYKLMEGYLPSQSSILAYLNPISGVPTMLKDAGTVLFTKLKDIFSGQEKKIYDNIIAMGVYNSSELIYAYNGLYRRDLLKDLYYVLGENYFPKLVEHWKNVDMKNTGMGVYDEEIKLKEGKKVTDYRVGRHPEYENLYGLVINNTKGKYVDYDGTSIKIKDYNFKKGNYAGKSSGFKFGLQTFSGGLVFQDKNGDAGLYFIQNIGGETQPVIVPVKDILLFNSVADMNVYASSKGYRVTSINL
jgi:hypothetical protein